MPQATGTIPLARQPPGAFIIDVVRQQFVPPCEVPRRLAPLPAWSWSTSAAAPAGRPPAA